MEKRGYYAIIPANVRYDKNLMQSAKLLYGEITALCNEKGYCWASDSYFAELYGVSKTSIQKWLKSLIDGNYIERKVVYKEGTKEILHRYITLVAYPMQEKLHTPIQEKLRDNNTSFNNTFNNTNKDILSGKPDDIPYKEILLYLNEKTGKNFKCVEANKKLIRARFSEGFSLDDFKKVIDIKTEEWLLTDMEKYLRPATLFQASKFDNYLNQKEKKKVGKYGGEYDNLF